MPQVPATNPPSAAPNASITDQVVALTALAVPSSREETMSGRMALRAGKKNPPKASWMAVSVYNSQTSCGSRTSRKPHTVTARNRSLRIRMWLSIAAVGNDAGQRADEKRGEHSHCEQAPNGESGAGELGQKRGRGDQIEPVAQQAHDLSEPEIPETGVFPNQFPIAALRRGNVRIVPSLQSGRHGSHSNNSRRSRTQPARTERATCSGGRLPVQPARRISSRIRPATWACPVGLKWLSVRKNSSTGIVLASMLRRTEITVAPRPSKTPSTRFVP